MYKHNTEARWCNHCHEKAVSITYSKCVSLATGIQHAVRMCIVACLAVQYYSTLSHKWHDFREKVIKHNVCFDFSTTFVWNISHSKKNWVRCVYDHKCILVFSKVPVILVRCQLNLHFSRQIFKKYSNIKLHENPFGGIWVVPCERLDRWRDMTKLIVAFCDFVNKPKNGKVETYKTLILPFCMGVKLCLLHKQKT